MAIALFILGAALGSFLYVIALRYDPDRPLWDRRVLGGRSRCEHCGQELSWFELVPLLSFLVQKGRCRKCGRRISAAYPVAEIAAGALTAGVPAFIFGPGRWIHAGVSLQTLGWVAAIWTAAFLALFLLSLIDLRLQLIPDELQVLLAALGLSLVLLLQDSWVWPLGSFLGGYGALLGLPGNIWSARFAGALIGAAFLFALFLITRGRGMGIGDVKLALGLGLLFGWPDILLIFLLSFVLGSVYGLFAVLARRKPMRSKVPFGPFLALAAVVVFFLGFEVVDFYFRLFNL